MAPRRKEFSKDQLKRLAAIGCTQKEVADYFGCSLSTVERRLAEPDYQQAWDNGQGGFKVSLRRLMLRRAQDGANSVLIFMAKNHLGMADSPPVANGFEGEVLPWCECGECE